MTDAINARLSNPGTSQNQIHSALLAMTLDEDQYTDYVTDISHHNRPDGNADPNEIGNLADQCLSQCSDLFAHYSATQDTIEQ